jgi:HlyD family secretion protein
MEKEFTGVVTAIANTANDKASQDAVTEFEVKVKILNSSYEDLITEDGDSPFRPGMTASVEIMTETKKDILTVPLSSVTLRSIENKNDSTEKDAVNIRTPKKENEVVFVVQDDNTVKMTEVKTGISDFEYIQISGLEAEQKVVRGPFLAISKTLKDGDLVEIKNKGNLKEEK